MCQLKHSGGGTVSAEERMCPVAGVRNWKWPICFHSAAALLPSEGNLVVEVVCDFFLLFFFFWVL